MTRQKVKASQVSSLVTKFLKKNNLIDGKTVEVLIKQNELTIRLGKKSTRKKSAETASGWGLIPLDRETAKFIAEDIELEYDA
jgi:hypothetical protein